MLARHLTALVAVALLLGTAATASAHCEIPCGIYGDKLRIELLQEDIATVEKSMKQIIELQKATRPNYNQLVRWVTNKDQHATKIQEQVSQYWLHQRIKFKGAKDPARAKYLQQLELLHRIVVHAMKAKQTTDLGHVAELRKLVDAFAKTYFSPEDLKHLKHH